MSHGVNSCMLLDKQFKLELKTITFDIDYKSFALMSVRTFIETPI